MVEKEETLPQDPAAMPAVTDQDGVADDAGEEDDEAALEPVVVKKLDSIANLPQPEVKTFGSSQNPSGVPSTQATDSWRDKVDEFGAIVPQAPEDVDAEPAAGAADDSKVPELEKALADANAAVDDLKSELAQISSRIDTLRDTANNRRPGGPASPGPQRHGLGYVGAPLGNPWIRGSAQLHVYPLRLSGHCRRTDEVHQVQPGQLDGLVPAAGAVVLPAPRMGARPRARA